ncbi:protein YIF1B-A isoform X2 [Neocloeon triangulifer]|uniref:protein YIF1B-A isoform X2 n=1 Tax=Neocloeon triangulifer TaxID=2078957 RepID=UPI00286F9DA1|nr:protein YIF1B-A isoform X2 [Neocloeon triangulifer]
MNFNASDARHPPRKMKHGGPPMPPQQMPQPYYGAPYGNPMTPDPMYNPNYGGYAQDGIYGAQPNQPYQPMPQEYSAPGFAMPGLTDPMANAAFQYGQVLMGQGTQAVGREFEKYVPVSRLKYYFAVDTGYVVKKMQLLLFPFWHSDWSIKYEADSQPVQPRYELNAPDLYIPLMAYVTYVLVAGLVLGTQERFTPEMLGIQASSALAWTLLELAVISVAMYITSIKSNLKMLDMLSYSGYKFIGALSAVMAGLLFKSAGYYVVLVYFSFALGFFQMRSLKWQLQSDGTANHSDPYGSSTGTKRRFNLLILMVALQTVIMWRLSAHLITP